MEFRFNLNEIFHQPIVEVGNTLIPPGFSGDKRALWDTQSKITQIVNAIGEASASAQGLSKPITTADRLRNSEHRLYLLIDHSANNGKGAVTGMLKTGEKGLYVFDREGHHYQVSPPCVLDFYIHESRQRSGFGRKLFEHMLQREKIEPVKLAIDRPSDKFLGFLNKHYGLSTPVKQMNNYVVFDGFFPKSAETSRSVEEDKSHTPTKKQSANGLQAGFPASPYGRYAAPRPTCSMGQIIHNDNPVIKRNAEPTGVRSEPMNNIQGQQQMYYSQIPAWQTTQSVPNMHYTHSQHYPQNSIIPQLPSSGDYQSNFGNAQQQLPIPIQNQPVQNQIYHNYAMSQGDATAQIYQDTLKSAAHQVQSQQYIPIQYSNANINQNSIDQTPQGGKGLTQTENNLNKQQSMMNYNPGASPPNYNTLDMQQYYQSQQIPNTSAAQSYVMQPTQGYMPTTTQLSTALPALKEPLIPQHFDGTVRRVPQITQSVPAQRIDHDRQQPVQASPSAPIGQIQTQTLQGTTTAASQMVNQNVPNNPPNQTTITGSQSVSNQQQLQSTPPTGSTKQTAYQQHYQNQATSGPAQPPATNLFNQYQHVGPQSPEQAVAYAAQPNYATRQQTQITDPSVHYISNQPSVQTMSQINQQSTQHHPMHEQVMQNGHQVMDQTQNQNQPIAGNTVPTYNQPNINSSAPQINVIPSTAALHPSQQNMPSMQYSTGNTQQTPANHTGQPSDNSTFQNIIGDSSQQGRFLQNTPVESYSSPAVNLAATSEEPQRKVKQNEEVDISKGYPPQLLPSPVAARPPIVIRN